MLKGTLIKNQASELAFHTEVTEVYLVLWCCCARQHVLSNKCNREYSAEG